MSPAVNFSSELTEVDQCPERFRAPLRETLDSDEDIRTLIYSPPFVAGKASLPGSVLGVTQRAWFIAHDVGHGEVAIEKAAFTDTLLVELTVILLYGQVKIDCAKGEQSESSACFFNTVWQDLYGKALYQILDSIDGKTTPPWRKDDAITAALLDWPLKFRNLGLLHVPPASPLLGQLYWPTILGGFRRELAPAGALFLTDRHLIVVVEERSSAWFRKKDEVTYGASITYFPRGRLSGFQIQEHRRFHILELEAEGLAGAEEFQVLFPPENDQEIAKLLSQLVPPAAAS
jgi:hypothetical protein